MIYFRKLTNFDILKYKFQLVIGWMIIDITGFWFDYKL